MAEVGENFTLFPIFRITYVILEGLLKTQLRVIDTCAVTSVCAGPAEKPLPM